MKRTGICPWCCEALSREQAEEAYCQLCGQPFVGEGGSELSFLDLRYEGVRTAQEARFRKFMAYGIPIALGVGLVVPLTHLGAAALIPLMIVTHLVAVKIGLIRDARRFLRPSRRFFSRWLVRLVFLWGAGLGYSAAVVPIVGAFSVGVTFAALTWAAHNYVLWCLWREKEGMPLALGEKILLGILFIMTIGVLITIVVVTFLIGWSVASLTN